MSNSSYDQVSMMVGLAKFAEFIMISVITIIALIIRILHVPKHELAMRG